ncbi:hypothetical protein [Thermosulfidibacter takaii]|uniref:hypothetical protein n=1 Tax=Thermosulfidibacter takaii TaxID=412593 RepID=UPI000838322C|nr:hypothetical protein [Thermosulfidibacter takaii]
MKRWIRKNWLLMIALLLALVSWYLLAVPPDIPYKELLARAFGGIATSLLAAISLVAWIWRR